MLLRSLVAVALTAVTTLAAVGPAVAQPVETRSVHVRVGDLDLRSVSGVARLNGRVARAVTTVCGNPAEADIVFRGEVKACRANAFAMAKPQVDRLIAGKSTQLAMLEIR